MSATFAGRQAASSHQQAFLLSHSRNATGFNQNDATGLAAKGAFDFHLHEKRVLLEAAACVQKNAPSRSSHPRGPSIPAPLSRAVPAQAVVPTILTPAVPAPQLRPAVPERPQ